VFVTRTPSQFVYNIKRGEVLGAKCVEWMKLIAFFIVFYTVVFVGLFGACHDGCHTCVSVLHEHTDAGVAV
jgi:hypothetical protein